MQPCGSRFPDVCCTERAPIYAIRAAIGVLPLGSSHRRSGDRRGAILTVCCEYPPVGGGGATACQALAEALVRAGHRIDVVTSGMRGLAPFEEQNGVRIHRVRGLRRSGRHSLTWPGRRRG